MTADRAGSTEVRTLRVVGFGLRMAWLLVELVLVWCLGIVLGAPVGSADQRGCGSCSQLLGL